MQRQTSRDSQATFNGGLKRNRNTPSPSEDQQYFFKQQINNKDFETFQPREDALDESSNTSSVAIPVDLKRRYEQDMHLMLDDLEMPNQSMNLSSLNHSQWQGRSTRSYLSSLSNNQQSSQQPSARQDTNSNLTMSNSHFDSQEKLSRHDDSPDFNRPNDMVSVTDELTVSLSDNSKVGYVGESKSYREFEQVQPPILKNQNRTFADSVINHQLNGLVNPKNPQTAIKLSGSVSKTAALGQSKTIDASRQFGHKITYLDSAETLEDVLDQSDISELDLLTRTQISHNIQGIDPNARSRIMMPTFLQDSMSQSQITVPGSNPNTKRTQNSILQQMVSDASDLNFTPDKDSQGQSTNSLNWQLKSHNAKDAPESSESTSQINTDRAQDYSNPITQLKERIKQSNMQKRQGSKSRDTELYEALETPYSKSLSELQLLNQELQDQNRQLSKTCEVYQNQISELQKQTNQKVPSGNDLMRARALEAARAENRELREQVDEREQRIIQLEKAQLTFEKAIESERLEYVNKIESLELIIEKQKILIQGSKRDQDTRMEKVQIDLQQALEQLEQYRKQTEQNDGVKDTKIQSLQQKLLQQETVILQCQQEIQVKDNKLKQVRNQMTQLECQVHSLETDLQLTTQQCKQYEQEVELVRQRNSQVHSLTLAKSADNGFDQEIKRLKQVHQQQINKLTEQLQSKQYNQSDSLDKLAQLLDVDSSAVFQQVQTLIEHQENHQVQLNKKTSEIAQMSKSLSDKESLVQNLQQSIKAIEVELAESHAKLKLQESLVVQQSSNFTKNLLHQKDVDLQNLKDQLTQKQEQEWQLQQQVLVLEKQCDNERNEKLEVSKELSAVRKLKQIAEVNVQELKDKLRAVLNQSQEDQLRVKYDELVEAVMSIRFADDPLQGLVDLQTSFTVHEQAVQHLQDQQKLAQNQQQQVLQLKSALASQQSVTLQQSKEMKAMIQSRELASQELKSIEEVSQRQSQVIAELEQKIIQNQDQHRFLSVLDQVIEGSIDTDDCQLRDQIQIRISKIQTDISKIEENPLQDKSGKHEAFMFLSQLQSAKWVQTDNSTIEQLQSEVLQKQTAFEMLNQQLMSELQLKTDEFEIEVQHSEAERTKHAQEVAKLKSEFQLQLQKLQEQHEFKLSELEVDFQHRLEMDSNQTKTQSKDFQDRLQQMKLEEKRLKLEIDRMKKQAQDAKSNYISESESLKDKLEQEYKVKLEDVGREFKAKTKEAVDQKVTQVRSEMLNKISELKNEHARIQAEWQRERSRWESQKQEQIELARKDLEKQAEQQVKDAKSVVERVWKKRLDELKVAQNEKLKEIDNELEELKQSHREELRKQTKIWQQKLKSAQETDMPRQVAAMTQVSPQVTRSVEIQPSQQLKCSCYIQIDNQNMFIEQLKINFEQELERYEAVHLADQKQKVQQTIQTFEQLICLEIEKILITLAAKASGQSADSKRTEINQLIKQLYMQHKEDQKEIKRAFEVVKQKVSVVLNTLKQQIEHKYKSRSTIQIDDTDNESQLVSDSSRQQIVRHSTTSSAEVNLTNNQSVEMSSPNGRQSEIKNYIEYQDRQDTIMQRLAPQSQSSKGTPVVEVDKVVRDLQMLYQTTKMAKFCRVLLGNQSQDDGSLSARSSTDNIVSTYRDLLNSFFRLISKLNQQSDQVCQDQEVFRLRLLNVDLNQQVNELLKEQSGVVTRQMVQDVIAFYQSQKVGPRVKQVLDALEQLHFQISKNQFKLNQLADLFTKEGRVNSSIREVAQKCDEFLELDQFMQSSFQNKYLPPEMMSPDETAHLIATVIQKLPNKTMSVSSEDILKQALQICHDQSVVSMPPLQRLPGRLRTASTIQTTKTPRSQSTEMQQNLLNMPRQMLITSGSLYQTVEPQNRYLSQPNIQAVNNDRYRGSSQEEIRLNTKESKVPMSLSQETDFLIEDGDAHHSSLDEELACAQSNVNNLFEKLKGSKFNTLQY